MPTKLKAKKQSKGKVVMPQRRFPQVKYLEGETLKKLQAKVNIWIINNEDKEVSNITLGMYEEYTAELIYIKTSKAKNNG